MCADVILRTVRSLDTLLDNHCSLHMQIVNPAHLTFFNVLDPQFILILKCPYVPIILYALLHGTRSKFDALLSWIHIERGCDKF